MALKNEGTRVVALALDGAAIDRPEAPHIDPAERPKRNASLSRRIRFAMAIMMLPVVAMAGGGILAFRSSVAALEEVRDETETEAMSIDLLLGMLASADDLGEDYIELNKPGMREAFLAHGQNIDVAIEEIIAHDSTHAPEELTEALSIRDLWAGAFAAAQEAAVLGFGRNDVALDLFHDAVDKAAASVIGLYSVHSREIVAEISALKRREDVQLVTALATLLLGSFVAAFVARRVRRSITTPLKSLEEAATRLGGNDLSHRVTVTADDELARVGGALNAMAVKLKRSREELQYQAFHDPLTGLPNRALFMERMEHAMARSLRRGTPLSVLYVDLDDFKAVNDSLGHETGDQVLVAVSDRLRTSIRAEDTAARLGGDEFGIMLEGSGPEGAAAVAREIARLLETPLHLKAGDVSMRASVGVATWRGEEGLDELLRGADAAMYRAKFSERGSYRAFDPKLTVEPRITGGIEPELRTAIAEGRLVLHYQPLMSLITGETLGFEALVRWNHPTRGLLQPISFIPAAERSGIIIELDKWVLNEACRQLAVWKRNDPWFEAKYVSVNVSAGHFEDPALVSRVAEVLMREGLEARDLRVEISEHTLMRDKDRAAATLRSLKALGVSIWLDDFGTGYSSLSYLRFFALDALKIDRSFVADVDGSPDEAAITQAIIKLGKSLRLTVVAEGVETAGQRRELARLGCQMAQGFLYSKPVPAEAVELMALIAGRDPKTTPPALVPAA
ncbi:MAG: EAL domain-containing protein [Actinomycetota bacterium]